MKRKLCLGLMVICCLPLLIEEVDAHPGRTDSNGCHTCRTNCGKWGLSTGQYHCHNGGTSSSSSLSKSSSSSSSEKNTGGVAAPKVKSKDNTLKSISINGQNVEVLDTIEYETFDEKVEISVETNDKNASYEIENRNLVVGPNNLSITVKAEDGSVKKYYLSIERKSLSSDTGIFVYVNEKIVEFENNKATVELEKNEKLNYRYVLKDAKSKAIVKKNDDIVIFEVTAEDGTIESYQLSIERSKKTDPIEEDYSGIIAAIAVLSVGGGAYCLKKRK